MISLEQLQDLRNLGVSPFTKKPKAKIEPWIQEIFDKFKIEDEEDQRCLSIIIDNLFTKYLAQQEECKEIEEQRLRLIREMSLHELIYHYTITWSLPKIVNVQPFQQPAGLVYYRNLKSAPDVLDLPSEAVSVKTVKSDEGVDALFEDIQLTVIDELYEALNPKLTAEIRLTDLQDFLKSANCNRFNKAIYNQAIMLSDSFSPMISNGGVIRAFDDLPQEKVGVDSGIHMDEILLRRHHSQFDVGLAFCPYILPIRSIKTNRPNVMARYGTWVSPDINHYYQRVKVIAD